ncbi:MAG: MmcQ/YjbR family DNA-binding protein, partial [Bacteroidota bacterium]
ESFPFDEDTLVFKVMGKMFALTSLSNPVSANLKCDPEYSMELREQYPERIKPGWHMSKKHWNTVSLQEGLREDLLESLIQHSYEMVVKGLKKADKEALKALQEADSQE